MEKERGVNMNSDFVYFVTSSGEVTLCSIEAVAVALIGQEGLSKISIRVFDKIVQELREFFSEERVDRVEVSIFSKKFSELLLERGYEVEVVKIEISDQIDWIPECKNPELN